MDWFNVILCSLHLCHSSATGERSKSSTTRELRDNCFGVRLGRTESQERIRDQEWTLSPGTKTPWPNSETEWENRNLNDPWWLFFWAWHKTTKPLWCSCCLSGEIHHLVSDVNPALSRIFAWETRNVAMDNVRIVGQQRCGLNRWLGQFHYHHQCSWLESSDWFRCVVVGSISTCPSPSDEIEYNQYRECAKGSCTARLSHDLGKSASDA
jgi:hypothetical protein